MSDFNTGTLTRNSGAGGGSTVFGFGQGTAISNGDAGGGSTDTLELKEFLKSSKSILPFVQVQESVNNISLELASSIKTKKGDIDRETSVLIEKPAFSTGFKPRTCLYEDVFEQLKALHHDKQTSDDKLYEWTDNVFIVLNFYTYVMSFPIDSAHDFRITDFFNYMRDMSLQQYLRNRSIDLDTPLELGLSTITINQLLKDLAGLYNAPSASQHALEQRSNEIRSKLHKFVELKARVVIEAPLLTYVSYGKDEEGEEEEGDPLPSSAGGGPTEDISGAEKIANKLKEIVGKEFRVVVDTCKSIFSDAMTKLNQDDIGGDATFVDVDGSVLEIDGAGFSIPPDLKSEDAVTADFSALIGKYKFSMVNRKIVLSVFNGNEFAPAKEIPKGASVQTLINLLSRKHGIKFPQGAMRSQSSKEYGEKPKPGMRLEKNDDICALLSIKGAGDEFARLIAELFTRSRYEVKPMPPVPGLGVYRKELPTLLTTGDNLLAENAMDNGTICIHLKQRRKLVIGILSCLLANPIKGLVNRFLELEIQTSGETIPNIYNDLDSALLEMRQSSYSGSLTATLLIDLISNERAKFNKTKEFVTKLRRYLDESNYIEFLKEIKNIGNYVLEPSDYLINLLFGGDAGEIVFERVEVEDSNVYKVKLMPHKRVEKKVKVTLYKEFFKVEGKGYVVGVHKQDGQIKFLFDKGFLKASDMGDDSEIDRQLVWHNAEDSELEQYNEWKDNLKPEKQTIMTDKEKDVLDMTALACGICLAQNGSHQYDEDIDEDVLRKAIESTTLPLFLREVSILPVNMLIKENGRRTAQFRPKFYRYVFFSLYVLVKQTLPENVPDQEIAIETAKVYIDFIYMTWINNDNSFDFYELIPEVIQLLSQSTEFYPLDKRTLDSITEALISVFKPFLNYIKPDETEVQLKEKMKNYYLLNKRNGLFAFTKLGKPPDSNYFNDKIGETTTTAQYEGDDADSEYVYTQSQQQLEQSQQPPGPFQKLTPEKGAVVLDSDELGMSDDEATDTGPGRFDTDPGGFGSDESGMSNDEATDTGPGGFGFLSIQRKEKKKREDYYQGKLSPSPLTRKPRLPRIQGPPTLPLQGPPTLLLQGKPRLPPILGPPTLPLQGPPTLPPRLPPIPPTLDQEDLMPVDGPHKPTDKRDTNPRPGFAGRLGRGSGLGGSKRTRKYVEKTNKKTKRSNRSKSKKTKTKKYKTRKYYNKSIS